jgi:hypothetical protein
MSYAEEEDGPPCALSESFAPWKATVSKYSTCVHSFLRLGASPVCHLFVQR